MTTSDIQQTLLTNHGLRITDTMSDYIASHLSNPAMMELPIIAGDARTGMPVHATIPLEQLRLMRSNARS